LDAHRGTEHSKAFGARIMGGFLQAPPTVLRMSQLPAQP
jgi:hypothetical protein